MIQSVITVEKYDICPKKDLPLLATWRDNAKVTGKVKAGERAQVIEHKKGTGMFLSRAGSR